MTNIEELVTLFVNEKLFGSNIDTMPTTFLSSSKGEGRGFYQGQSVYYLLYGYGLVYDAPGSNLTDLAAMCIKRD